MMALFAIVFLVRLVLDILMVAYYEEDEKKLYIPIKLLRILHDIFTKLQWLGIYLTILEVFDIMNKLRSPSPQEYEKLAQKHKWRKIIIISIIAIFETIQILF
jgi:hypothetical protein